MPLSSYFVDFTAYIDELRRPENFPHEIHDKQLYEVESIPHLQHKVNQRFVELISSAGLVVFRNDAELVEEAKITFDKRVYVPWHMITHMKLDVKLIPARISIQDSIVPGHVIPDKPQELVN